MIAILGAQVCFDLFFTEHPRRICEPDRIIQRIAVPIQALRIPRLRHDRIRTGEPSQRRVVVSGIVEIQPTRDVVQGLPGEAPLRLRRAARLSSPKSQSSRRRRAEAIAALPPRLALSLPKELVAQLRDACAGLIGRHRRAAQACPEPSA